MTGLRGRLGKLEAKRQGEDMPDTVRPLISPGVWPELAVWLCSASPEQQRACPGLTAWLEGRTA